MTSHPAGNHVGVGRVAIWYGREVEGILAEIQHPTAFIDAVPHPDAYRELASKLNWNEVSHIFFTENFEDWEWVADVLVPELPAAVVITIGTHPDRIEKLLALSFIDRCSLMVRATMEAPWIHKLRPADQVSVGVPYKLTTWVVSDGVRTEPDDYLEDKL